MLWVREVPALVLRASNKRIGYGFKKFPDQP